MNRPPAAARVTVTIDEVVLRGVPREQAATVVAALEHTLGSLVRADPAALGALTSRTAGTIRPRVPHTPVPGAAALGARAATAVWSAVGGGR